MQFEKWFEKYRASKYPHTCQSAQGENLARLADRDVWRAALQWAAGQIYNDVNGYFNILKELEEL